MGAKVQDADPRFSLLHYRGMVIDPSTCPLKRPLLSHWRNDGYGHGVCKCQPLDPLAGPAPTPDDWTIGYRSAS